MSLGHPVLAVRSGTNMKNMKKFIIPVIGQWRSRASSINPTIMTSINCNRSFMALEPINVYANFYIYP